MIKKAFTLVEAIIVIAIFLVLVTVTVPQVANNLFSNELAVGTQELVHSLRKQQALSTTQVADSSWGIYIDTAADQYTLYAGVDYVSRDTTRDLIVNLPSSVSFGTLSLTGGGNEVLFAKRTGETAQDGTIEIISGVTDSKTITISPLGHVTSN